MNRLLILFLVIAFPLSAKEGTFINPLTDICWECLFPITISGINVTPGSKDLTHYNKRICVCSGTPPKVGIPISFWEPESLIDVTRHAYKLLALDGVSIGNENIKNRGSIGRIEECPTQNSFYHVHYYKYPILYLLEILTDFTCIEKGDFEAPYISELDPLWNNDEYQAIFNPEASLFANPLAQIACIGDCLQSSFYKPNDALFWCAGCEGSLYPFTGHVGHHVGGIQASALLVYRLLAKLHRVGWVYGFEKDDFCEPRFMPIIKKSLYKTQLVYPIPQTEGCCPPLGKSDMLWGAGKSFPNGGEDFVYLIWKKKQCCLDAVKPAATAAGVP